jgi:hypothetical protein
MGVAAIGPTPKYHRAWTRVRDRSTERTYRQLLKQYDLAHCPQVLVRQFAQVAIRSNQLDRQIAEIEKGVHGSLLAMDATTFPRWSFFMSEFRRYADSADRLAKAVFGERASAACNRSSGADHAARRLGRGSWRARAQRRAARLTV